MSLAPTAAALARAALMLCLWCGPVLAIPKGYVNPCEGMSLLTRVPRGTYDKAVVKAIFRLLDSWGAKVNHGTLYGDDAQVIAAIYEVTGLYLPGRTLESAARNYLDKDFDAARRKAGLDPAEHDPGYTRAKLVRILHRISDELDLPINYRILSGGFPEVDRIVSEEVGFETTGAKFLAILRYKDHLGGGGLEKSLRRAGYDYQHELRSCLSADDVRYLLGQIDAQDIFIDEKVLAHGDSRIDRLVSEYTGSQLGTKELWIAIKEHFKGEKGETAAITSLKLALESAEVPPEHHGLTLTMGQYRAKQKGEAKELFARRSEAAVKLLQGIRDLGILVTRASLLEHEKTLDPKIKELCGEDWTARSFLNWLQGYPGGFTEARRKAGAVPKGPRPGAEPTVDKSDIIEIFSLMHDAGVKVNATNLSNAPPETKAVIESIIEAVLGRLLSPATIYDRARFLFKSFEKAQLAADLDPKTESFRSKFNRADRSEEELLIAAVQALVGKRPLDYRSISRDETPETARLIEAETGFAMTGQNLERRIRDGGYGGWYQFMEKQAKIDPAGHRINRKEWTPEKQRAALYWLHYYGLDISPSGLQGNAKNARYRAIIRMATGSDLSPVSLFQIAHDETPGGYRGLLKHVGKEFGLQEGLDYRAIYHNRYWNPGDIIQALRLLKENGVPLNFGYMRRHGADPRIVKLIRQAVGEKFQGHATGLALLNAAASHYTTLDEALWSAEIDATRERKKMYSYRALGDRALSNLLRGGASPSTIAHVEDLIDIVDAMPKDHRRAGFLILDTVVLNYELKGNPDAIAKSILIEYGQTISPRTVRNFLTRLAANPGFEGWRPK